MGAAALLGVHFMQFYECSLRRERQADWRWAQEQAWTCPFGLIARPGIGRASVAMSIGTVAAG